MERILNIYNQGIEDRIATLETDVKDIAYMNNWFQQHQDRYAVIVAEFAGDVIGWASLNPYSRDVLMTVLPTCPYTSIGHSEAKESEVAASAS